jgi:hypothetical protein
VFDLFKVESFTSEMTESVWYIFSPKCSDKILIIVKTNGLRTLEIDQSIEQIECLFKRKMHCSLIKNIRDL